MHIDNTVVERVHFAMKYFLSIILVSKNYVYSIALNNFLRNKTFRQISKCAIYCLLYCVTTGAATLSPTADVDRRKQLKLIEAPLRAPSCRQWLVPFAQTPAIACLLVFQEDVVIHFLHEHISDCASRVLVVQSCS
jgi:hypothetical protein